MKTTLFIVCILLLETFSLSAQSLFFKQYWVEYDGKVNNNHLQGERTRVNDREMSTHPNWYKRFETQVNGLAIVEIPDTIIWFERAELFGEMWGGHPKTANKRFQINGGEIHTLPSEKTAEGHCEYLFPTVPIDFKELVQGYNALQFNCDRGESFWGHFLLAEIAINGYLKADSPELKAKKLEDFKATPKISSKIIKDETEIGLDFPTQLADQIEAVHYFGWYLGYDESGTGNDEQWHGFQFKRKFTGNIGTSTQSPFRVNWNTKMIPDQAKPMAIKALIQFKNGLFCWSEVVDGLSFPLNRPSIKMYYCSKMPVPFWSRDNQLRVADIELPNYSQEIETAELWVKSWDGGAGNIENPFTINDLPYKIIAGNAPHDLVFTKNNVKPENLKHGTNEIRLLSDTEHHGIEICWPGPCLVVRYKQKSIQNQ